MLKADRGVQAKFDDVPPSLRHLPGVSGGVNLLKLLEVTPDGSIPENIAKVNNVILQLHVTPPGKRSRKSRARSLRVLCALIHLHYLPYSALDTLVSSKSRSS